MTDHDGSGTGRVSGGRHWKTLAASIALIVTGVAALVFMGPQFLVFVPIVLGAWLLARFGLVPRAFHPRGESVRIVGGPEAGALSFAEITIAGDDAHREATLDLLAEIVERLDRRVGPGAAPVARVADLDHPDERAPAILVRHVPEIASGTDRLVLAWPDQLAAVDVSGHAAAKWAAAWPALVREQALHGARFTLEVGWRSTEGPTALACCLGARDDVGPVLARFARDLRERRDVEAWTSGWVRDAERQSVAEDSSRRRRAGAARSS